MSTILGNKIREIRESLKLGRQVFCDLTGLKKSTLIRIETGPTDPSAKTLQSITKTWPQYTMWLMNDEVIPEAGQISPEIEDTRKKLKTAGKAS